MADNVINKIIRGRSIKYKMELFDTKFDSMIEGQNHVNEKSLMFMLFYYGYANIAKKVDDIVKNNSKMDETLNIDERIPIALIYYFIKYEDAFTLNDMMMRRLKFSITESENGLKIAPYIAKEMAKILSWSEKDIQREIEMYEHEVKCNKVALY